MVEGIEALLALERTGTISEAAAQLRLTQSAVSKRIQSLENDLKYKLIEPDGRRVRLTPRGVLFLDKARVLFSELKSLRDLSPESEVQKFSIAVSDSVAASWGPRLIRRAAKRIKAAEFEIHVHRSTLVEENVKLGRYHLGLCISPGQDQQLVSNTVLEEPMVLITGGREFSADEEKRLITIEKNSGSWRSLDDRILRHPKLKSYVLTHIESFAAIIQMVREGYGHGLVPLGIAQVMGVPKIETFVLAPGLKRQIKLISRKNVANLNSIKDFREELTALAKELK